jgi:hypothetical protein
VDVGTGVTETVGDGEALVDGELSGVTAGDGLTADACVQLDRTTATLLAAEIRAKRRSIGPVTENRLYVVRPDGML